jgi:hypothetical protein
VIALDYTVVVAHPISVRFRRPDVATRLKLEADAERRSASALIEELVDEGLRSRRFPQITFRNGPTGRRAAVAGGPDVWEIVDGVVGGDIPVAERVDRAVELFGWARVHVDSALAYYAEYSDEIDRELEANRAAADEAEAAWNRVRDAIAR